MNPGPGPASPVPPPLRPIQRLLVANRGEPVVRIARTARRLGMTVLGLSVADEPSDPHWHESVHELIPVPSYLDRAAIVSGAVMRRVDAVHPGWGFLAEDAAFAEAIEAAGIVWVGPPPAAMRALGDKAAARRLARRLGIPTLPGYDGDDEADATLQREAARIGFPVLLKPSAGGGGKGMHLVETGDAFPELLARARREARAAFGDDRMVLERYVEAPRHIEIQSLFDRHGTGVHLGERECSLQRRHQKVIEEAPSPAVDPALRDRLGGWALALGREAGYESAGTAEFLLNADGEPFFLELNARLQVEHPVTEAVTGFDLVAEQLRIAAGEPLGFEQERVQVTGHAIEARLYAEDPWAGFVPSAGTIVSVVWPKEPQVRIDAGIGDGREGIGTRYDPMLAKIVARGADRAGAIEALRGALYELRVHGITTNRGFLGWLLRHPPVVGGTATTATIDRDWHAAPPAVPDATWGEAARALVATSDLGARAGFRLNAPPQLRIVIGGEARSVAIGEGPGDWQVQPFGDDAPRAILDLDGLAVTASVASAPTVEDAVHQARRVIDGGDMVVAPMPGTVLAVHVAEGDEVEEHQVLMVLEAMKMENAVAAPAVARVRRVHVTHGQTVQRGQALVELG